VDLIKAARGASKDRQELLAEINSTTSTCRTLKDFADMDSETWAVALKTLSSPGGPTDGKLAPSRTRAVSVLKWTLSKDDVHRVRAAIERQKNTFNVSLASDSIKLSMAIQDKVDVLDNSDNRRN